MSDAFEFVQTHTITPGVDPDDDRIADAWESQHFGNLTAASVTSNADGDPATDLQQYLADTHPTHATRYLGITDYASTGTTNALMWTKCIDAALSC